MRYSKAFIKTKKKTKINDEAFDKKNLEVKSYDYMIRSGMIKKLVSGIYEWLPLGLKVLKRVENIIREEMDKSGALEVLLPAIQPKELWEKSERWNKYGRELLRIKDRNNRDFCFGPTHEEVITDLVARESDSYRDLPLILYQIQTKFRDEIRPRFGVMRAREFLMKDAYSFDKDDEGANNTYKKMYEVYTSIFNRFGLNYTAVEADTGTIGGNYSHEFVVISDSGESEICVCEKCSYSANLEKAKVLDLVFEEEKEKDLELIETIDKKTISEVSKFLSVSETKIIKSLIYIADNVPIIVLIRGDRDINEFKLINAIKCDKIRLAEDNEIKDLGFSVGYIGPIGINNIKIIADFNIKNLKNVIVGANKKDFHYINVNIGRDFFLNDENFFDLSLAKEGDKCHKCGGNLKFSRGIEVGHIFKLGTKYSKNLAASYLDEKSNKKDIIMGCYGIGVSRVVAACIEQCLTEKGMNWPISIAPYIVELICLDVKNKELLNFSNDFYENINKKYDTLFDDRMERPGIKFNDADLLGIPIVIIIGKRFLESLELEIKIKETNEVFYKNKEEVIDFIDTILKNKK